MALLTKSDVVTYSKIDKDFPTCDLEDIKEIEWKEFNDILGYDFYVLLEEDKDKWESDEFVVDWGVPGIYLEGAKIRFEGSVYVALGEIGGPGENPNDTPELFVLRSDHKFENECYRNLWCNGLARYLSLSVVAQTILPASTPLTGLGVVEKSSDYTRSASTNRVKALEGHYYERRGVSLQMLDSYVSRHTEDPCKTLLAKYRNKDKVMGCGCQVSCGCGCGSNSSGGWYFLNDDDDHIDHGGHVYVGAVKKVAGVDLSKIKGYDSQAEGDASGDQVYYLTRENGEGAFERVLIFNDTI